MDFNPTMEPPRPPPPPQVVKSGGGTIILYIVIFFLCVISVMAGAFYYQTEKTKSDFEKKEMQAKSDFEKQRIQAEADLAGRLANAKAEYKAKEKQLMTLESKVNADLKAAAKTVKEANDLKAAATKTADDAAQKLKEAKEAQAAADASGAEVDKKLADEKAKLAKEAAVKVTEANKKAEEAAKKAIDEANKARDLKAKLDKANITLKGNENEIAAAKYNAVPGYQISGRTAIGDRLNVVGPEACILLAPSLKANVWGYRNNSHPDPTYRKSCFFYGVPSGNTFSGLKDDAVHMIGCTYGGNPRTGCDKVPPASTSSGKYAPTSSGKYAPPAPTSSGRY